MQALETEVKFRVHDRAILEQHLRNNGFRCVTPSTFERNTLYDTAERHLRALRQILRIRQYGEKWVVTHKRMPDEDAGQSPHKQRIETETEVEDGAAMASIFTMLGFKPAFIYEKWRTEFSDATGHCVIDETPIGLFAELEGPADWIDAMIPRLKVAGEDVMTLSYGRLFEKWKKDTGSPVENLTFGEIEAAHSS
jgi:adenylate cyclase class 2